MSVVYGKEVTVKDKIECLITFAPCDYPAKTVHTEDLENFLAQAMKEPRAMKISNFKKIQLYYGSQRKALKIEKNAAGKKVEDKRDTELLIIVK